MMRHHLSRPTGPSPTRLRVFVVIVAILALMGSPAVLAAGHGGGSGGSGGSGGGGGSGGSGEDPGSEYSDLVVALRDVDGRPILQEFEVTDETGTSTEYCVQPVTQQPLPGFTDEDRIQNPVDGHMVYRIPLMGDPGYEPPAGVEVEPCDPQSAYSMYVSEAELERLNMTRTNESVLEQKLSDVEQRLLAADTVTLDGAGRLVIDGIVADAGPENAALFKSLMMTGTIPGLADAHLVDGKATVGPFGPWQLAASAVGAAASKFVPISIDAVMYYNRLTAAATPTVPWRAAALPAKDGDAALNAAVTEQFVNYRGFSYNRNEVFKGCVTWLDVPTLTWHTDKILDVVDFAALPPIAATDGTMTNAAAFAQLAEDARATIYYLHEHEVIAGFTMDPVGQETCVAQHAALTSPAVSWGGVPTEVVQTETFPVTASLYSPMLVGEPVPNARVRIVVDAVDDFTADDLGRVSAVEPMSGQSVPFELVAGDLVGYWGPAEGFPVDAGYRMTTAFEVTLEAGAPTGTYQLRLELFDVPDPFTALAADVATLEVLPAQVTALWSSVPGYVAQDTNAMLSARVYNPDPEPLGVEIQLTLDAIDDFTATSQATAYSDAVRMPLVLDGGNLVGTLDLPPVTGRSYRGVTWYVMVAEGAPLGQYTLTVEPVDGVAAPDVDEMYVGPADSHGSGGSGGTGGDGTTTTTSSSTTTSSTTITSTTTTTTPGGGGTPGTTPSDPPLEGGTNLCEGAPSGESGFGDLGGLTPEQRRAVECLVWLGITDGTTPSTFSPRDSVRRDSMASFLARLVDVAADLDGMAHVALPRDPADAFDDDHSNVHEHAINRLAAVGIVMGTSATTYGPSDEVTRAQMASFLTRTLGHLLGHDLAAGPDRFVDDSGSAHHGAINALAFAGIVQGTGTDTYDPSGSVSRAQMASFLVRTLAHMTES